MCKLTDKQRELVTLNHSLIYSFARKYNVDAREYYDVLAIGLCKAAKAFNPDRGKFSTIAYTCMRNELLSYWNSINKKSAIPRDMIFSYDSPQEYIEHQEYFCDNSLNESMMSDIMYSMLIEKLNDKEKEITRLLVAGFNYKEIADEMGCTKQNIGLYVNKIRKKLNNYLKYN